MKTKIIIALIILFTSCEMPHCGKWKLLCFYGAGGINHTTVVCDSLTMVSNKEAIVWINGVKSKVVGEELHPSFLPCEK